MIYLKIRKHSLAHASLSDPQTIFFRCFGHLITDEKTEQGDSSPENPALHIPDPYPITRTLNLLDIFNHQRELSNK